MCICSRLCLLVFIFDCICTCVHLGFVLGHIVIVRDSPLTQIFVIYYTQLRNTEHVLWKAAGVWYDTYEHLQKPDDSWILGYIGVIIISHMVATDDVLKAAESCRLPVFSSHFTSTILPLLKIYSHVIKKFYGFIYQAIITKIIWSLAGLKMK